MSIMWKIFLFNFVFFTQLFGHYLTVCTIFKDNAEYFKEWIEFHKLVGVEHFYLYNNSSTDNSVEVLKPYIKQGLVTLINWPNREQELWGIEGKTWVNTTQEKAYLHCCKMAKDEAEWVAVLDVDEFLIPDAAVSIPDFLHEHEEEAAIFIWWRVYGTSGVYELLPGQLLVDLLDKRFPDEHMRNQQGKVIFRPRCLVEFNWAGHNCICKNNAPIYVSNVSDIRINHYVNRTIKYLLKQKKKQKETMQNKKLSKEKWLRRIDEGNDVEDRIMDRFIPELKIAMGYA